MDMIDAESLLTVIFVLVDDWYQEQGYQLKPAMPGPEPKFSESEMLTLLLAMDYLPYPGETQYLGYIRANYLELFPNLVDQSQFNRRGRRLGGMLEALRRSWVDILGATFERSFLLDTKPIPVVGYRRSKRHSRFEGTASYGYCAARKMHYFGYKLVMVSTLSGLPVAYSLVPANTDERAAAESVLGNFHGCDFFGDKGFIGQDWQEDIERWTGNRIWTTQRQNQRQQNPVAFDRLLSHFRERIEGVFHEIQNTGRHLEHLLRRSFDGLFTHVAAKIASHTLRLLLKRVHGIDVLSFQQSAPSPFL